MTKTTTILLTIIIGLILFIVTGGLLEPAGDSSGASSATLMDRVKDLQREVGCGRIDGVVGPETMRLINAAVEAESQERATEMMLRMGAGPGD